MDKKILVDNLKRSIDEDLVSDLIEYYGSIKERYILQDIDSFAGILTKYCETVFQILEYLRSSHVIPCNSININEIIKKLEQTPQQTLPESVRLIIPRITKCIYDMRSKRGLVHKKDEINPSMIDIRLCYQFSSWILSEFIRLYHVDDEVEITKILHNLGDVEIPLIEKFEDDSVVFSSPDIKYKDKILFVLFSKYPKRITVNQIISILRPKYSQIVASNLRNVRIADPPLIHQNEEGILLTKVGLKYVTNLLNEKIKF